MKNYEEIKTFKDADSIPASQISPEVYKTYNEEIVDHLHKVSDCISRLDDSRSSQFKKGQLVAQALRGDAGYENITGASLLCIFNTIRDKATKHIDNLEQQQELLGQITAVERAFETLVTVLESNNYKLDLNSVLPIIHGYINECTLKYKTYEDRPSTKH
tara:strand:+ start:71 stop:550 length:480 start_codon:yes stop_codon:yes gene_type:complete